MSRVEDLETETVPPLEAGQRLDQATFHRRYEAMPPNVRAELVGGVVYMPSPLGRDHGVDDNSIAGWLFTYTAFTPGVESANNATVILGDDGEIQPDCQLRILHRLGGQSKVNRDGYIAGAPELVVEVALSSRYHDLNAKKTDCERAGVPEYLVVDVGLDVIHWFIRRNDRFENLLAGPDGIYRSEVFPGLWLDADALFALDRTRLIKVLNRVSRPPTTRRSRRNCRPRWGNSKVK